MNDTQQKEAARKFAAYWKDKGYEKGESQPFWLSLLRDVYGVEHPEQFITFEEQVHLDHTSFIDGTIPSTKVLIEQKGLGKDLKKPIKQSDGTLLTPFQQAKRYITELPLSQHPRWVVTCNFEKFFVYDMERPGGEPEEILLKNLEIEYYRLQFLVDEGSEHLKREMEVSIAAGEMVGLLYDAFHKQYADPDSEHSLKSLNILCVRLVFCLYAEDAGIFGHHGMFHDYLAEYSTRHMRKALVELFKVLDTTPENRDPYLKDDNPQLAAFPYVNGGLFANEDIEIPPFTDEIRALLLDKASTDFNWSEISPTIFGAVFESTLNPETRRSGGMHYTSIENIHKVIDPLFLDDLKKELGEICEIAVEQTRKRKLEYFQNQLASLTFLDPFCGSGTLLIEAAMLAMNMAPGANRAFQAERWLDAQPKVWQAERERAVSLAKTDVAFRAVGYDIDPAAVSLSLENAKKAGVIAHVRAEVRDVRQFSEEGPFGCVVCNPPYGERLLDLREAEKLYKVMGERFERRKGWSYSVITPDEEFENMFGRKADKRRKLYNGMIKCQYYQYFK